MKTRVLDSWPILEWILARKPGSEVVAALLSGAEESTNRLLISAINVGEIYYFLRKNHSESLASLWRENSATLPITIEIPTADDIWNAASLKAQYPISYADAFAAALAQKHQCPLVTGDPEFRSVTQIELEWIDRDVIQ